MDLAQVRELTAAEAISYIARRRDIPESSVRATDLGGGVSNNVVLVETGSHRLVLKQALSKLRVQEEWFSDRSRIFRESESLSRLYPLLPDSAVPRVLFEDRANFLYAMTAAPAHAVTWKAMLLRGETEVGVAESVARIQGSIMRATWNSSEWLRKFGDLTAFDQLRLDAYYRFTARRHPDLDHRFQIAIQRCQQQRVCLVHGDWSPKNMLVEGNTAMAIDFECVHFGDPSFDTAFLLNHLLLKSFHNPRLAPEYALLAGIYWKTLSEMLPAECEWLEAATLLHVPLLLLARIDGKSPVEYITCEQLRERIRRFARDLVLNPPERIVEVFEKAPA
jgi:hypothetical protein